MFGFLSLSHQKGWLPLCEPFCQTHEHSHTFSCGLNLITSTQMTAFACRFFPVSAAQFACQIETMISSLPKWDGNHLFCKVAFLCDSWNCRCFYSLSVGGVLLKCCITSEQSQSVGYLHSEASHLPPDVTVALYWRHSSDRGVVGGFACGRDKIVK